jgi:hypothetical protein
MSFNIEQLKVNLYTNLEGKNKNIVLTKNLIYYPDTNFENLNEYPYFTYDIIYPISTIYTNLPTYKERVELFFNKEKFNEILSSITSNGDSKADTKDYNTEQNIMIMLELLFPTKFPAIKNLHESYNIVLGGSSITNHIFNPTKTRFFSYSKIDSKVYTTKKVVWLNDILNHPLYRDLLEKYRKFWLWTQEENVENMELMNKTYEAIEKEYNEIKKPIPPEYRNFAYGTLNQYRKPFRITTNVLLQNLINCSDNTNTTEFYKFMKKVYEFYMKNNVENPLTKQEEKLLKVNLNYINTNATSGLKREIYVLVDFIEGEINDANIKTIYCPFTNRHLGNELDYLLRNALYKKKQTNNWEVDKNRMKFNIETNKNQKISKKENVLVAKPIINENIKEVDETIVQVLFLEKILKNNEKIGIALTELNKITKGEILYENNILDFFKNNNNELFKIIVKWSERTNEKSEELLNHMIKTKNRYNAQTQIINKELERYNIQSNEPIKNLKMYEKLTYILYKRILTALIDNESQKKSFVKSLKGGNRKLFTKRRIYNKNYKTRKFRGNQ